MITERKTIKIFNQHFPMLPFCLFSAFLIFIFFLLFGVTAKYHRATEERKKLLRLILPKNLTN
ncbi:MAG: hypothetical protein Q8784_02275 [Vigna little leaf phytoplasma]|nr:hypothetical protein [Vigna little leaf phytoplasma]